MHPILFRAGAVTVYSYGFMVAVGFVAAALLASRETVRRGFPPDKTIDLALISVISGIAGGRLLHVLLNTEYYIARPVDIFMLNKGGLAFQGALITAVIAGAAYLKRNGLSFWRAGDIIAPYIAIGQAFGRIGCLLNGCCYGKITDIFPAFQLPGHMLQRHPVQLYYVLFHISAFFILRALGRARPAPGLVFLSYFILYSAGRLGLDFLRGDLVAGPYGLTVSQYIAAAVLTAAFVTAVAVGRRRPR